MSINRSPSELSKPFLNLVDESFYLLKSAPPQCLLYYLVGTLPFVLTLFLFWIEMSQSSQAGHHLGILSWLLALLFIWMKSFHCLYYDGLRSHLQGLPVTSWNRQRWAQMVLRQTIVQPSSLLIIPLSALLILPFATVQAFYENFSVLDDGQTKTLRKLWQEAREQSSLSSAQNLGVVWLLSPTILILLVAVIIFCTTCFQIAHHAPLEMSPMVWSLLFILGLLCILPTSPLGVILFLNLAAATIGAAYACKLVTGEDNFITLLGYHFFNSSFYLAMTWLTVLVMDPLMKCAYVLRCFSAQSQHSGQDLVLRLRPFLRKTIGFSLIFVFFSLLPLQAQDSIPPKLPVSSTTLIKSDQLDRSIKIVLAREEFSWRLSQEETSAEPTTPLESLLDNFGDGLQKVLHFLRTVWEKVADFLNRFLPKWLPNHSEPDRQTSANSVKWTGRWTATAVIFLCSILLLFMIWRIIKSLQNRNRLKPAAVSPMSPSLPDLNTETTLATALPVNEWQRLAEELTQRGEFRLALRAYFLACLAALAEGQWISVQQSKSNQDYLRELTRRAPNKAVLLDLFRSNIRLFERGWYGTHEVNHSWITEMKRHQEQILALR